MRFYRGSGEYVGRPSPLGNPFFIGPDGSRAAVIEKYRRRITAQLAQPGPNPAKAEFDRLLAILKQTGAITLICWCAPLPCHADVIADLLAKACFNGHQQEQKSDDPT
jgi:hypothetical protein